MALFGGQVRATQDHGRIERQGVDDQRLAQVFGMMFGEIERHRAAERMADQYGRRQSVADDIGVDRLGDRGDHRSVLVGACRIAREARHLHQMQPIAAFQSLGGSFPGVARRGEAWNEDQVGALADHLHADPVAGDQLAVREQAGVGARAGGGEEHACTGGHKAAQRCVHGLDPLPLELGLCLGARPVNSPAPR